MEPRSNRHHREPLISYNCFLFWVRYHKCCSSIKNHFIKHTQGLRDVFQSTLLTLCTHWLWGKVTWSPVIPVKGNSFQITNGWIYKCADLFRESSSFFTKLFCSTWHNEIMSSVRLTIILNRSTNVLPDLSFDGIVEASIVKLSTLKKVNLNFFYNSMLMISQLAPLTKINPKFEKFFLSLQTSLWLGRKCFWCFFS